MVDKVIPVKQESLATGGQAVDDIELLQSPANINQDALEARGYYVQNDTSNDTAVFLSRDASDNLTLVDAFNSVVLSDLAGQVAHNGTATLNFGSVPGTNLTQVNVTGQTAIQSGSTVEAFMMLDSTATHNDYEHMVVPLKLVCGNIIAGTGFTIYAVTDWRLTGTFNVRWKWS